MDARYIVISIPIFFVLIALEIVWSRARRLGLYTFHDAVTSLGCGVGQQVLLAVFLQALETVGYAWVYEHHRLATIPASSGLGWVALILGVDLAYYVYHRASHRVSFLWATHVVHHQSEEYNLTTALRQSWFTGLTAWLFYLPLAVLGFSPAAFITAHTFNILYQFWIHTRAVRTLGPLELVFNTPSHHRVHHGVDPAYIDTNYAGVFIVWDRLFGTFSPERQEPSYGTVKAFKSFNATWANVSPWIDLALLTYQARNLADAVKLWVLPPGWRPAYLGGEQPIPEVSRDEQRRYAVESTLGRDLYIALHFTVCTAFTAVLLAYQSLMPRAVAGALVLWVIAGLTVFGGLAERRRWAVPVEVLRMVALTAIGAWMGVMLGQFVVGAAASLALAVLSAFWVARYHNPRAT